MKPAILILLLYLCTACSKQTNRAEKKQVLPTIHIEYDSSKQKIDWLVSARTKSRLLDSLLKFKYKDSLRQMELSINKNIHSVLLTDGAWTYDFLILKNDSLIYHDPELWGRYKAKFTDINSDNLVSIITENSGEELYTFFHIDSLGKVKKQKYVIPFSFGILKYDIDHALLDSANAVWAKTVTHFSVCNVPADLLAERKVDWIHCPDNIRELLQVPRTYLLYSKTTEKFTQNIFSSKKFEFGFKGQAEMLVNEFDAEIKQKSKASAEDKMIWAVLKQRIGEWQD